MKKEQNQKMDKSKRDATKARLTFGIMGFIAGIFLLFSDSYLIGIFGGLASAGLAIKAYIDLKNE